ncbi:MAG: catalase [Rhodoferax sp.]|nr:catalase [Rhodoferax sp.]
MAKNNTSRNAARKKPASQPAARAARGRREAPTKPVSAGLDVAGLAVRTRAQDALASAMPANATKPGEHGFDNALAPPQGARVQVPDTRTVASTLSEVNTSDKTGGQAAVGHNAVEGGLRRVRADSGGQRLTTNQGVPISDNQNSLKFGLRGPALLEDFVLREKITHFDHERIPERIVHARGSGAHGYFECLDAMTDLTRAAPFQQVGKKTPVFVRFSTVAGERGSKDTARDVRGFAVKFYTDEGNWDLVGNNMPVFFIQDAMKFPDLVHAVKPEPHHGMPQAASAHDTFWDFVSLMPESTHMLMWVMSDRALPRSLATMEGFGVHSFRLVNAAGESVFVKFHWKPTYGTVSLVWDEAVKISGADPDFHRRDLWERIETGAYPEWELGVQVIPENEAEKLSFDILDATKLVPEELYPVRIVGRMVLNRNPDNFFAETEQVAFCTAHVVPGIDFSNDPLLAGRIHSYVDTQISRLGGPNFHEIPINAPLAPVHNNQRDGMHRQAIARGQVAYEPNSLGGGCPFQAGAGQGFATVAARLKSREEQAKVRGKPEKFADHYTQATLFFESQTAVERRHIVEAFCFELGKVTVPAIRERMVSSLRNVSDALAQAVADGLGMRTLPPPMPRVLSRPAKPEITRSPSLSLTARPGRTIRGSRIALLAADGMDGARLQAVRRRFTDAGAMARVIAPRLGTIDAAGVDPGTIEVDATLDGEPGFLFDAVVLPQGDAAIESLGRNPRVIELIKDMHRHGKTIVSFAKRHPLLERADISAQLPGAGADPGVLVGLGDRKADIDAIEKAIARHSHPEREAAIEGIDAAALAG